MSPSAPLQFPAEPTLHLSEDSGATGDKPLSIDVLCVPGASAVMILDGAEELSRGEYTRAERSLQSVYPDLRRISSDRHCRLEGFVYLALLSCVEKDYSEAVTLLLASVGLFEEEFHLRGLRHLRGFERN